MLTDRFEELRKKSLLNIFQHSNIVRIWRDIVRTQLRNLDFQDYFDNYDLNYNIENRAKALLTEISKGNYKTSTSLIYKLEKKLGICRHVIIPNAIDALVLQVLIDKVSENVLLKQPSKNSFYSRDRHAKPNPSAIYDSGDWRNQWKRLQKEIYKFQKEKELIVVTDISNYYDSIHINELRKVLLSYCQIDEVLVDLLFKIIEDISWRPDYLPYSFRGLPTTNLEGVRLLAHCFLFEIDDILKIKTNESFTRWMDDIIFAVNDKREAIKIINSISDLLKSRGLALNLSKTKIFSKTEALEEFLIEENHYIDDCEKSIRSGSKCDIAIIINRFKEHLKKNSNLRYFDKVTKRYLTLISKTDFNFGYDFLTQLYLDFPSLRIHILLYLSNSGYNQRSSAIVIEIINSLEIFDDISLHQIIKIICEWEIGLTKEDDVFLENLSIKITNIFNEQKTIMNYLSILMFKVKYNHPEDVFKFISYWKAIWEDHHYGRRQVMASLSRLLNTSLREQVTKMINSNISSGILSVITICTQLNEFSGLKNLEPRVKMYLFPPARPRSYPFYKFLILCSILNSETIRNDGKMKALIKDYITDPYYLKWIEIHYNIK